MQSYSGPLPPCHTGAADVRARIDAATRATVPSRPICPGPADPVLRDRPEFNLARALKAIPSLADAATSSLRHLVESWYERTPEAARRETFLESFADFCRAWRNVRYPAGEGPLELALKRAKDSDLPPEAMVLYHREASLSQGSRSGREAVARIVSGASAKRRRRAIFSERPDRRHALSGGPEYGVAVAARVRRRWVARHR